MFNYENVCGGDILITSGDFVEQIYFVMKGYIYNNFELKNQIWK